ncbi:MAG: hypothetical protein KDC46_13180 [Thermoleophilia bacterium]|nr:hypothetical protein [Thermoleophilia bacterium]
MEPTGRTRITSLRDVIPRRSAQLELPFEGLPSARRLRFQDNLKEFAFGFAPRLGSQLLMRIGTPMVAATTPLVIDTLAPEHSDDWTWNLAVGSGLGGAWGAMVGGLLPFSGAGERIPRIKSAGVGAASGIVLAPAVAAVSKYVVDWITTPIRGDDEPSSQPG